MTPPLRFRAVSKWYGQISALIEIQFDVGPGITGLVGKNGAGKSTLLKLAVGMLRPSLGAVEVLGRSPRWPGARRRIGFCPDLERCYERLSGHRFVSWMLRLNGYSRGAAQRRAGVVLERLELGEAMHRKIAGYSKGMRQKVKLAQALAHDPDLLMLDEPMTGLDPVARHEMGAWIRELGDQGKAVLVSSHVLHELQRVADHFVLVHQGRVLAEGGVEELRSQLSDRPRRLRVTSPAPRELAARVCAIDGVDAVAVGADGLLVDAAASGSLQAALTAIGAESALVSGLEPIDDDLASVFGYLVD